MAKSIENKFDTREWYLSNFDLFEESLNGNREDGFHNLRRDAITRFSELGFPTPRDESWKYTNVAPILQHKFSPETTSDVEVDKDMLSRVLFDGFEENRLVFVNGIFRPDLSDFKPSDGVTFGSLAAAFTDYSDLLHDHLGRIADFEQESFVALNTAFAHDGFFLYAARDVIAEPIQIVYLSQPQDGELISHPRNLIVAEKGSQVSFIETYCGTSSEPYFSNVVAEVLVEENAHVELLKIQDEGKSAFHVSNSHVHQDANSTYTAVSVDLGSALVRNNINIRLDGENGESHIYGFFLGTGRQHIDNQTFVDHAVANCFSNELYKGILDDHARGVFNGKILVRQDAQKTNALQSNKTLLLTNDASINAKPQLEIFADDVKCTHGATIGQLDDEALFYLRSRGISEDAAGAMLRHAFASDVFDGVSSEPLKAELNQRVLDRLSSIEKG